jgi:hypothetical protein
MWITSQSFATALVPRCTTDGCERERSVMTFGGRTGAVIDVYFHRPRSN